MLEAEKPFREGIDKLLNNSELALTLQEEHRAIFQEYKAAELVYFYKDHYIQKDIDLLHNVLNSYQPAISEAYIKLKKDLLDLMSTILTKQTYS